MAKPKIFVSHSSLDTAFATKLVNDLNAAGADAWMDVNDLGAGNFQESISEALTKCEWFLLALTQNALTSDWVRMEVDAAIRLKHQKRMKELIFVKATTIDLNELPALWGVYNVFDAVADYNAALDRTLKTVGVGTVYLEEDMGFHPLADERRSIYMRKGGWDKDLNGVYCPNCGTYNVVQEVLRNSLLKDLWKTNSVRCGFCMKLFLV